MDQNKAKFSTIFVLFMMSIGLMNHVMVIPMLLSAAKRDSWISVLISGVLFLGWLVFLQSIIKKLDSTHLFTWLKERFGKIVAWGLSSCAYVFILILIGVTLKDMIVWTVTSYFPLSPAPILALVFLIICFFAATSSFTTLSLISGFLLVFVVGLGFFVMSLNIPYKDYAQIFPILENDWNPVLKGIIYSSGSFLEVALILFLQHKLKPDIKVRSILFLGIILIGLTLGPLLGSIAIFGPEEAANQRYPAYEEWRLLKVGQYIEHVDFFSIYQWLSGGFIRISLGLFIMGQLFPFEKDKSRHLLIGFSSLITLLAVILPISDMQFVRFLQNVYFYLSFLFLLLFSLCIGFLAFLKGVKGS
ncbi:MULTISPECIES: endospore germination permease [unclassified Mesobacillus]|uniref:GerAB/ArcD/ProY family transporter n=1 Tax=unclassified Mesobacillus TaxID=2675270 RepID=UPI00203A7E7A|nr:MULTISPECIES: endospore germination permease [unclassified Mesobacillus]MCM3125434.1 endospore germination permease [Mesobacillus sp. MER 33]MCM3234522.1 endospore germination permease [Mesobacillus sp. MER 48]